MALAYEAKVDPLQELVSSRPSNDDWNTRLNYIYGLGIAGKVTNESWQPFLSYSMILPNMSPEEWLVMMFQSGSVEPESTFTNGHSNTMLQEVCRWIDDRQVPLATSINNPNAWYMHVAPNATTPDATFNAETSIIAAGLLGIVYELEGANILAVDFMNLALLDQLAAQ